MEQEIFKLNDRVYHFLSGWGTAIAIKNDNVYPIFVEFDNGDSFSFTLKGEEYVNTPPTLSFTEYDLINGGFSQDRDDRVIFTNSIGEPFTKNEASKGGFYYANKNGLCITYRTQPNGFEIDELKEDENHSEVFKTREGAEKWLEGYNSKLEVNKKIDTYDKAIDYLSRDEYNHLDKKLSAFRKLLAICEAWNEADGFIPDYSDDSQKYYPTFHLQNNQLSFYVVFTSVYAIDNPFTFKTEKRAEQFGTQFIDLFKQLYK